MHSSYTIATIPNQPSEQLKLDFGLTPSVISHSRAQCALYFGDFGRPLRNFRLMTAMLKPYAATPYSTSNEAARTDNGAS
jgi:hypothetical protein